MKYETGDIFFTNNYRTASKIVCFLQKEKTIWHHVYKVLFNKPINEVRYYHVGMILNSRQLIEQQRVVEIDDIPDSFAKSFIVYRKKNLTMREKSRLIEFAMEDLGEGYGIVECIGKTISWLTGIKEFAKWFDLKDKEICINRVASWYLFTLGETFGAKNYNYLTTDKMDEYLMNSKEWQIVNASCFDWRYK